MIKFQTRQKCYGDAIIGVGQLNPLASVNIFRYKPDIIARTMDAQTAGECGTASEAMLLLEEGISPTPEERLLSSTKPVFEVRF